MFPQTNFKIRCHRDIEATIKECSYVKSPMGIFIQYIVHNEKKNFFIDVEQVAELFEEEEIIDRYIKDGSRVVMQNKVLFTITGKSGEPVQHIRYVEYKWEHVELNDLFVQTLAVIHEFERINKLAKVVEIAKDYFKKTA